MASGKVFIGFRRDAAVGFSHAIRDRLVEHVRKSHAFMDVQEIAPGAPTSSDGCSRRSTAAFAMRRLVRS